MLIVPRQRSSQFHDHTAEYHASHAGSASLPVAIVSTEPHVPGHYTHAAMLGGRKALMFPRNVSTAAEPLPGSEEPPWFRMLVDEHKVMTSTRPRRHS